MTENQSTTTRSLDIADAAGQTTTVRVTEGQFQPIALQQMDDTPITLTWSEWAEVSDHIEYCRGIRPELAEEAVEPANPNAYALCGAGPEWRVSYDALPCVLERGHPGDVRHCDRLGRRW